MPKYRIVVEEIITYKMTYVIVATSEEKAREHILGGVTFRDMWEEEAEENHDVGRILYLKEIE